MEIIIGILVFLFILGLFSSGKEEKDKRNDKIKLSKPNVIRQPEYDNADPQKFTVGTVLGTVLDGLGTLDSAVGQLNAYVNLNSEVQKSVSIIDGACSTERIVIDVFLEASETDLYIERRFANDKQGKAAFDANLAKLVGSIGDRPHPHQSHSCVDIIYRREPHREQEIEAAIQQKYKSIIEEHTAFLTKITQRLQRESRLRALFEERMQKHEPDLLKRIHCFEAGGEWRYVTSFRETKKTGTPRFNINTILAEANATANEILKHIEEREKHAASVSAKFVTPASIDENQSLWQKTIEALTPVIKLNNSNQDKTKQDIESIATDLEIPFLLHFTQATNLASILHHGIYSRGKAQDVGITSNINDNLRLDNRLNGTSLSIAYPNAKMFYKYRLENPNTDWIVLAIAPSVLWEKDCVFCKKNAATKLIRGMPNSQLKTSQAFQSMFDDDVGIHNESSRVKQNLYPCDPTDVQAEILVFDIIEPQYINAIIFEKSNVYKYYSSILGEHPALISGDGIVDFFAPRTTLRKSKMISFIPKGEAK
ncbi:DarT ssDNA thymidine ADP-ribosyltransferase family protein [Aeromonas allosaccharophila]|uniref:DarT ssDNA thymidine ADP-ribosyltransferase family protein n=1 Tax=Aeromonas allosaccharophila TaxID=656 RepID=UPI002B47B1A7|nr:DarT ssDNA thymidine ADP-ribosyltransferase family protein [Aeromonas allosaccharophila]